MIPFLPNLSSFFRVFSLTMSSFISGFAIGMGGSDSEGSIQQPLVDRKIVSVGGSSSKDTRHDAFNSDSSSSERLRVLCRAGGGTSRFRGKAQPFTASPVGEPVSVTMILPPSVFGGAR